MLQYSPIRLDRVAAHALRSLYGAAKWRPLSGLAHLTVHRYRPLPPAYHPEEIYKRSDLAGVEHANAEHQREFYNVLSLMQLIIQLFSTKAHSPILHLLTSYTGKMREHVMALSAITCSEKQSGTLLS